MGPQSDHLSDAQIEQYGTLTQEAAQDDRRDSIEQHLAGCAACRERVLVSQRRRFSLVDSGAEAGLSEERGRNCPSEELLRELAAGLTHPDLTPSLIEHASQCNRCGSMLRMYCEDFSDATTAEDKALLRDMKTSTSTWQKKMARRYASKPRNG